MIAVGALLIGGLLGYVVGENMERSGHEKEGELNIRGTEVPVGMHRMPDGSMMGNGHSTLGMGDMDHMMDMMVESEQAFIRGMIPHHEEAVDTAKEVLVRGGTTPEMRTLAENIITAQEKEIATMKVWYEAWYGTPYIRTGTYTPMMRDLSTLSGVALDRVFLEDMIMHHMGALMMAQSVTPHIEHQEMKDLTNAIMTTQSEEIRLMRTLLQGL